MCIVLFIATSYHARESFHFVMYSVVKSYEMDAIDIGQTAK